ncbi:TPA: hypothetical protein RJX60_003309 [Legionella pneumophila]|nr:hypothetical protein A5478_07945 [Legionella pneumophila]ANH15933.1 hypothetical protein A5480_07940 [Legionella pneumophila]ANH18899.1 hypothetical protein A5479_07940 [Legionella pneumophila]APX19787.1 hypothetical protein A1D14_07955 [Legionella pneumophila]AQL11963.1 hypothetical protein A1D13_07955 [Legionella pneumophila]
MLFLLIGSLTQMAIAVWTFFADTAEMPRAEIKEGALVLTIILRDVNCYFKPFIGTSISHLPSMNIERI